VSRRTCLCYLCHAGPGSAIRVTPVLPLLAVTRSVPLLAVSRGACLCWPCRALPALLGRP